MKLLVTGGAGFIGSNFIHYWLEKYPKDYIINLDLLTYAGNPDNLKEIAGHKNYQFIRGDIANCAIVATTLNDKVDLIVHFAAESHVDNSIRDCADFIKTNVVGTQVLLEAAKKRKIRFHHISTDEVFGSLDLESQAKFDEKTPYDPRSPYSASKAASDHLVRAYVHTHGLQATITNCSNNYGAYQHPEKLIPLFITNLLQDKKVPLYGDGLNVRDWLYVTDHCQAIDAVIKKGRIGETYCIGGNSEKSNQEIARLLFKKLGKSEKYIQYVPDRKGHDRRYAIDSSKIKKELGWEPSITFTEGIDKTIKWYQENEGWWKKLKVGKCES
jgi:dTDP-glucose 4,6-dehydratase